MKKILLLFISLFLVGYSIQAQILYVPGGTSGIANSGNSSNVGIGTSSPQKKLDVRGDILIETGTSPSLFTGTGTTELNRYLRLLNSPGHSSASGLKAGGVLVADSYGYANPGKNDLIAKGRIGIGTTILRNKLEVGSGFSFHDGGHKVIGFGWAPGSGDYAINTGYPAEIRYDPSGSLRFGMSAYSYSTGNPVTSMNGWILVLNKDGNVGIGVGDTKGFKLAVNGNMKAKEVKVTLDGWSDFVFASNYVLPTLTEVESFIKTHKHLPEIPSEAEVLENGIELGAMDAKLLRKIEELILYTIEQEKKLASQQGLLDAQVEAMAKKEQQLDALLERVKKLEEVVNP